MALTQISSDGVKDGAVVNADINASAAIAFSKLQDVSATDRILGRDSSGAGDIEEITPANVRTMLNVEDGADVTDSTNVNAAGAVMNSDLATKGQILIGDGSGDPTALAVGTNDHVLTAASGEATGVKWAEASSTDTLSFRNLIINGAFQIWQRGTSSNLVGYRTADRWQTGFAGTHEDPTRSKLVLTSSDTGPWEKGFRNAYRITNGNQTSVEAGDEIAIYYAIEAQDMSTSGWDYTSSSSKITLQFWVRSSIAQNYYGYIRTIDGTQRAYAFETGSLSANTWTKITKTIPGDSNISFDVDANLGMHIVIAPFYGTNYTTSGRALNTWINNDDANRVPDMTNTWYDTNDATFDLTGVQLEVGSTATEFEHRSYGEELVRCLRYYQTEEFTGDYQFIMMTIANGTLSMQGFNPIPYPMRVDPTITHNGVGNFRLNDWSGGDATCTALAFEWITKLGARWSFNKGSSGNNFTVRYGGYINTEGGNDAAVYYDAEL